VPKLVTRTRTKKFRPKSLTPAIMQLDPPPLSFEVVVFPVRQRDNCPAPPGPRFPSFDSRRGHPDTRRLFPPRALLPPRRSPIPLPPTSDELLLDLFLVVLSAQPVSVPDAG